MAARTQVSRDDERYRPSGGSSGGGSGGGVGGGGR
jgi:hypothetical protein